jgi:hypothetical protein
MISGYDAPAWPTIRVIQGCWLPIVVGQAWPG